MQVTYELTPDDLWHYNQYYVRHKAPFQSILFTSPSEKLGAVFLGLCMLVGAGTFVGLSFQQHSFNWGLLSLAPLIFALPRLLPPTKKRLAKIASQQPGFLCEHIVSISPEWLAERSSVNDNKRAWTMIQTIEEDSAYFFLFLSKRVAFIIPKRAFGSLAEEQAFLNAARRYWNAAKEGRTLAPLRDETVWPPAPRPGG